MLEDTGFDTEQDMIESFNSGFMEWHYSFVGAEPGPPLTEVLDDHEDCRLLRGRTRIAGWEPTGFDTSDEDQPATGVSPINLHW